MNSKQFFLSLFFVNLVLVNLVSQISMAVTIREVLLNSEKKRNGDLTTVAESSQVYQKIKTALLNVVSTKVMQSEFQSLQRIKIRVVEKEGILEASFDGETLTISKSLADDEADVQTALLAHEVTHLAMNHKEKLIKEYEKGIPGEVVQEETDKLSQAFYAQLSLISKTSEYEADANAVKVLRELEMEPVAAFMKAFAKYSPNDSGDASHPSSRQRLMQIRLLSMPSK